MTVLDIVLAIGILIGVSRGLATGVIRQIAGLTALLIGFAIAIQLMGPLGSAISDSLGLGQGFARILVFIVIVIAVHVLMAVAARLLETVVGMLKLTSLERALGGVLGGIKAALILSVALLVLAFFNVPRESSRMASSLYEPVAGILPEAWDYVAEYLPIMKRVADEFGRDVADRLDLQSGD